MLWEILPPEFHLLPSEATVSSLVVLMERDSHQTTGRHAWQVHCQQVSGQKLSLPSSMKANRPVATAEPPHSIQTVISLPLVELGCIRVVPFLE